MHELRPEVLLLDVQLPDMNGFEVCKLLPSNGAGPAVVLVSSRDAADYGDLIEESGARGFDREGRSCPETRCRTCSDEDTSEALLLVAGVAVGVAASVGAALLVLTSDHEDNKAATLALALTAGVSFIASGLIAAWRRPGEQDRPAARVGRLPLGPRSAHRVEQRLAVHGRRRARRPCLRRVRAPPARLPVGRLPTRLDRVLVASAYAVTFFGSVAILLVDETPSADCETCRSTIAVTDSQTASDVLSLVGSAIGLVILIAILVIVVRRFRQASPALRRVLAPVFGAGTLAVALLVLGLIVDSIDSGSATPLEYVFLASFAMVPIAFLAGICEAGSRGPPPATSCSSSRAARPCARRSRMR